LMSCSKTGIGRNTDLHGNQFSRYPLPLPEYPEPERSSVPAAFRKKNQGKPGIRGQKLHIKSEHRQRKINRVKKSVYTQLADERIDYSKIRADFSVRSAAEALIVRVNKPIASVQSKSANKYVVPFEKIRLETELVYIRANDGFLIVIIYIEGTYP